MVLMDIGPVVEEVYGSSKFLFLYVATGVVGFLFSARFGGHPSWEPAPDSWFDWTLDRHDYETRRRAYAGSRSRLHSWVVSIFVFDFVMRGVDNWAHGGGLALGSSWEKLVADREPMNARASVATFSAY